VRQHARLRGDLVLLDHAGDHFQQRFGSSEAVGGGVDADARVAGAVEQAVEDARRDPLRVVGRVVRLQAHRQRPGQAERVAVARDHAALAGDEDEVLVAAQFGDGRDHLGGQAGRECGKDIGRRVVREQPLAELSDRQPAHRLERGLVVVVEDQARDLVALVSDQDLLKESRQRHVGEDGLGGDAFAVVRRRDAGQAIARAQRRRLGHHLAQIREGVARPAQCRRVAGHGGSLSSTGHAM
jgi:hypothetical protein